jgi:hypothetical protein
MNGCRLFIIGNRLGQTSEVSGISLIRLKAGKVLRLLKFLFTGQFSTKSAIEMNLPHPIAVYRKTHQGGKFETRGYLQGWRI